MDDKKNYDQNYFLSSELSLCSTLICLGFSIDSLDKSDLQRTIFIFKRTPELNSTVDKFWQRKLTVEPLAFFETQRYLKSRIYGG